MKHADIAVDLGRDTVVVTNVLFRVKIEGPRTKNATARNTMATDLRNLVEAHGTKIGDDLTQAIDDLDKPLGEGDPKAATAPELVS